MLKMAKMASLPSLPKPSIKKSHQQLCYTKTSYVGRRTLFVNAAFTESISELAADEFNSMMRRLYSRI